MDYKTTVYIIVKPPAKVVSAHKVANRQEYDALLDKVKQGSNCLYYAEAVMKNGKQYAKQPWILDLESVTKPPEVKKETAAPEAQEPVQPAEPTKTAESSHDEEQLVCACGKKCSSKSGLVLHRKNCQYDKMLVKQLEPEAKPDTNVLKEESATELSCPFCDKKVTSTPGRTLHVKNAHPEKLEEYYQWLKQHGKK